VHSPRGSRRLAAALLLIAVVAGCSSAPGRQGTRAARATAPASPSTNYTTPTPKPVAVAALARGERWITLPMPGGVYRPQAEAGGTDDYRCILLDPKLTKDVFLSGVVLQPGNAALVHHAILYRVEPNQVAQAEAKDRSDPRLGWSCFGGPGLTGNGAGGMLDAAPWVAAFATTGGEQRFAAGTGQRLAAGSRLVLQMHYNLLNGSGLDNTSVRLRVAGPSAHLTPLQTYLLPAPVELPCAARETGPLCNRAASIADVGRRFGEMSAAIPAGLQLLCGGSMTHPKAGPTQSCTRTIYQPMLIRAVAGHMHMLGRSIRIDLLRRDGTSRRLLDVKVWNFDDQRATVLAHPVAVRPGDRLRVSCTHDASLRSRLPELRKLQPRYVVWGEGSSDEMCLGIVSYTG
jgi:hypothetical protein